MASIEKESTPIVTSHGETHIQTTQETSILHVYICVQNLCLHLYILHKWIHIKYMHLFISLYAF